MYVGIPSASIYRAAIMMVVLLYQSWRYMTGNYYKRNKKKARQIYTSFCPFNKLVYQV